jgi:N-acetylated-alpha-linked acidic dipeptidase
LVRWVALLCAVAACGGEKKKKVYEDAAPRPDAMRVTGEADRDALFLSVPTAKAASQVIERLSAKPHIAGTPANEEVAREIMRTLGRMGWRIGTQQFDVYMPQPKKLAIHVLDDKPIEISTTEPSAGTEPVLGGWNMYSASGKVSGALVEDVAQAKGKILLVQYGAMYRGAQVAAAERAGAKAVIFYPGEPRDTLQRGTVMYYWQYTGDPLTPGVAATRDAKRLDPAKTDVLPMIPIVNITHDAAAQLRAAAKGATVEVEVVMDGETRPVRDVIAILEGKSKDAIILGNHYDAWGPGAIDPHSGTATLIEIARGLAALTKAGWRPKRTIVIAFWDAEEPGVIGSTEWVEDNADMVRENAVAYFNVDAIKAGALVVKGTPALRDHVRACTGEVRDPITDRPFAPTFDDAGIGSDFTAFLHHAGVATLTWQTGEGPGKYTVWHSMRDDFAHAPDALPGFTYIPALAGAMGLCAIRLADAEYLPLDDSATADWLDAAITKLAPKDRAKLDAAIAKLRAAAAHAESHPVKAEKCNAALIAAERGFLDERGIAGRPWYRNLAIGPDPSNGYAPLALPELAAGAPNATDRLAAAIERVATALAPCASP